MRFLVLIFIAVFIYPFSSLSSVAAQDFFHLFFDEFSTLNHQPLSLKNTYTCIAGQLELPKSYTNITVDILDRQKKMIKTIDKFNAINRLGNHHYNENGELIFSEFFYVEHSDTIRYESRRYIFPSKNRMSRFDFSDHNNYQRRVNYFKLGKILENECEVGKDTIWYNKDFRVIEERTKISYWPIRHRNVQIIDSFNLEGKIVERRFISENNVLSKTQSFYNDDGILIKKLYTNPERFGKMKMFFQKGIWTQEITYDSSYNPVAITLYNPEDIIEEQYTYKYEYDQFHNWIRKEEYYNDLLMNFWKREITYYK
jgi:hypothetical protein